jgi:hypothetical protein
MRSASKVATCALALLGSGAAFAAESGDDTALSPQLVTSLQQYLAALISARNDVIDLKYIEPDDNGDNAGWGVNYTWNASKDSSHLAPDARNHFVLRKLTYDLDIRGSYAFADTTNNADLSTIKARGANGARRFRQAQREEGGRRRLPAVSAGRARGER